MKNTDTLKKNFEFRYILNKGRYYGGQYLDVYIVKNNKNRNLIGIAVSVKVANAVKRNKIKRRIRESYRLLEQQINLGYNMVLLWKKKKPVEKATFQNIDKDLKNIFRQANLIKVEEK